MLIAYDGTRYCGWQRQNNGPTIQGEIEGCLRRMTGEPVIVHGAGRTDSGVHALAMVGHFQTQSQIFAKSFHKGLNSMLARDIRILDVEDVETDFHSRYSSLAKTYRYDFCTGEILLPTKRLYKAHFSCRFSHDSVRKCLEYIKGEHDFSSFEASGSRDTDKPGKRGAVRIILAADCCPISGEKDSWSLYVTGDGFLRHMVRNIAGTLLLVGRGSLTVTDFKEIMQARDRRSAGPTAPANGLFLVKVWYGQVPENPHAECVA